MTILTDKSVSDIEQGHKIYAPPMRSGKTTAAIIICLERNSDFLLVCHDTTVAEIKQHPIKNCKLIIDEGDFINYTGSFHSFILK